MAGHVLRLLEDRLVPGAGAALPARNRALYVLAGEVSLASGAAQRRLGAGGAWYGRAACSVEAGDEGATVLRWELAGADAAGGGIGGPGIDSRAVLSHPIDLVPGQAYLMRCDRVDFAPGREARPHRHQAGGIRRLIAGELEVRIAGHGSRTMKPGDAWFESGAEAVHVDPADAHVTPRRYILFVDEPIELPG